MKTFDLDRKSYDKYYQKYKTESVRKRLRCVLSASAGHSYLSIAKSEKIHNQSVSKYVKLYAIGGFKALCETTKRSRKSRLTDMEAQAFKAVLLSSRPFEHGLEGNIWTGEIMCLYLKKVYDVEYKKGIYDLLERLNLSHQKAHADYGNADAEAQKSFYMLLENKLLMADEKTAVLKYDEFSICEKPTSYYGWAEKNTRPTYPTNEKKENVAMDF
ncbi:MAG: winged helix-turn-helix domain-containing protein [Bacteroidia bacterium]